jgi:hypothetical protein
MSTPSQYCEPTDLANVINPQALTGVSQQQQLAACIDASAEVDGYLNGRYNLPLVGWDGTIRRHTAYIAVYILISARGYNPSAGADEQIRENYYKSVGDPRYPGTGYFPGIQRQMIHPTVQESLSQIGSVVQMPQVSTSPQRGWSSVRGIG